MADTTVTVVDTTAAADVPWPDHFSPNRTVTIVNGPRGGRYHHPRGCATGRRVADTNPDRIATWPAADTPAGEYCIVGMCGDHSNHAAVARHARLRVAIHDLLTTGAAAERAGDSAALGDICAALAAKAANNPIIAGHVTGTLRAWQDVALDDLDAAAVPHLRRILAAEIHPARGIDTGARYGAVVATHTAWLATIVRTGHCAPADITHDTPAPPATLERWVTRWNADLHRTSTAATTDGWVVISVLANLGHYAGARTASDHDKRVRAAVDALNPTMAGDRKRTGSRAVALPSAIVDHITGTPPILHRTSTGRDAVAVAAAANDMRLTSTVDVYDAVALAVRVAA